jgi:hypothetical protein
MFMSKRIVIVMLVLALAAPAVAQTGDAGQLGATARIGQGARALGMGQAYTAVADDESGIFYNPAGVALVRTPTLGFAWRAMSLLDRKQGYFSLAIPLREEASIGFSWVYSGVGDIVERNVQGVAGETFSFNENFVSLAFAKLFGPVLSIGGAVHFVNQSFFDVSANAIGLSFGVHASFDRKTRRGFSDFLQRLTLAASVQHAGMTLRFDSKDYYEPRGQGSGGSTSDAYPIVVRGGAAYRLLSGRNLIVSAEGTWVKDQHVRAYAGAEWAPDPRLMLRAGLADTDPTFGLGIRQSWGSRLIALDYAFLTSPVSESAEHVISLGIGF